jgi:CHAT domain-containing protein
VKVRQFARWWPLAAALFLAPPAAASGFDPEDPAYSHLYPLMQAAETSMIEGPQDAAGKRVTIVAYEALRQAALATRLPDDAPHPLAAWADIKIGSQLYILGEPDEAIERARRGADELEPYLAAYPLTYAEAAALVGVMMAQAGNAEEALPMARRSQAEYAEFYAAAAVEDRTRSTVVAKSNLEFALSQILARLGENGEALRWQRVSLDTRREGLGENDPDTAASWYGYAQALLRNEQAGEAEAAARTAVEIMVRHNDPTNPSHARALEMLGIVLSRTGRPIEATGYLVEALALKRENEGTDNLNFAYGVHNLGGILFNRERYEDAEPFLLEASQSFRAAQGESSPFAAGSLAYAGQIAFAQGRPEEAIDRLREAETLLGGNARDEIILRIQPDMIAALAVRGELDEAHRRASEHLALLATLEIEAAFPLLYATLLRDYTSLLIGESASSAAAVASARALLRLLEEQEAILPPGPLPADRRAAIELAMDVAVRAGEPALMLSAMRRISTSSVALATKRRRERLEAAEPELADALRTMQDASAAFDRAETAYLSALASDAGAAANPSPRDAALARLEAARSILQERFPEWIGIGSTQGTLTDLAASLALGEALLAVAPVYGRAFLLLVTPDQTLALQSPLPRAEMVDLARRLGDATRGGGFDAQASHALHDGIFPAPVAAALEGVNTLRIHAGGALGSLPFALLQAAGEGESQQWLIDRFALVSLSDLTVHSQARTHQSAASSFLAVAAPLPFAPSSAATHTSVREINQYYLRSGINPAALGRLPSLDRSRAEAEAIADLFPPGSSRLLLGAAATEASVLAAPMGDASILLFATHGLVSGEVEGMAEPALVLSPSAEAGDAAHDGLLTASEIAELDLAADWVILSACNSAAGATAGLPAFSGLAQAFRHAGAGTLLVSHWQVRDDVAAFLSVETLRAYRSGMSKPQALRAAMLKLRQDDSIAGGQEPFAWAPFVLLD